MSHKPVDSAEFRQVINGLLKERVLDAQKTDDGKDARQVLETGRLRRWIMSA